MPDTIVVPNIMVFSPLRFLIGFMLLFGCVWVFGEEFSGNIQVRRIDGASEVVPLPDRTKAWVTGFADHKLRLCDPYGNLTELRKPLPPNATVWDLFRVSGRPGTSDTDLYYALVSEDERWSLKRLGDDGELLESIGLPEGRGGSGERLHRLWDGRLVASSTASRYFGTRWLVMFDPGSPQSAKTFIPTESSSGVSTELLGDGKTLLIGASEKGVWLADSTTGQQKEVALDPPVGKEIPLRASCAGKGGGTVIQYGRRVWRLDTAGVPLPSITLNFDGSLDSAVAAGDDRHVWIVPSRGHGVFLLNPSALEPMAGERLLGNEEFYYDSFYRLSAKTGLLRPFLGKGVYLLDARNQGQPVIKPLFTEYRITGIDTGGGEPPCFAVTADKGFFLMNADGSVIPPAGKTASELFLPKAGIRDVEANGSSKWLWALEYSDAKYASSILHCVGPAGEERFEPRTVLPKDRGKLTSERKATGIWIEGGDQLSYFDETAGLVGQWKVYTVPDSVEPSNVAGYCWLARPNPTASFTRRLKPEIWAAAAVPPDVELRLGTSEALTGKERGKTGHRLTVAEVARAQLLLQWPGRAGAHELNGKATLTIARKGKVIRERKGFILGKAGGKEEFALDVHDSAPLAGPHTIRLTYYDDSGTHFDCEWPEVKLVPAVPFWSTPLGHALKLWLGMLVFIVALRLHPGLGATVQRYAPILAASLATLVPAGGTLMPGFRPDMGWTLILVGGTFVLAAALGLLSPALFRRLSGVFPLNIAAPFALNWRVMRRRIFAPYAYQLRRSQERIREAAQEESYLELPADAVQHTRGGKKEQLLTVPAGELTRWLLDSQAGGNVFIVAPGGMGKSALLREVVDRVLATFERDGRAPLPVLCEDSKTVLEAIKAQLANHAAIPEMLEVQLQSGFFLVVIDGASESPLDLKEFEKLLEPASDLTVRLLVSTRPHTDWEKAFRTSERRWEVRPRRLDETSLGQFLDHYAQHDAQKEKAAAANAPAIDDEGVAEPRPPQLSEAVLKVCRDQEGYYLPVLARLAQRYIPESVETVADIYGAAADQLIGTDEKRKITWALCRESYWRDGRRMLARTMPGHQDAILVLSKAGMLVAAGTGVNQIAALPDEYRFFHDSMQSYLTAEALAQLPEAERTLTLFRAAGAPEFAAATGNPVIGRGSELFQFCVQVFLTRERLVDLFAAELIVWGKMFGGKIPTDDIVQATPESIRGALLQESLSSAWLLDMAVRAARALDGQATQLRALAGLFSALAPLVWPHAEKRRRAAATKKS